MANKIPNDGNIRIDFVPALADPTAPTVAELTGAGVTPLADQLTPDGYDLAWSESTKPTSVFSSTQDTEEPGRIKPTITLKYFRVEDPDAVATALVRNTAGFIVVRYGKPAATAFAANDKVDVFTVKLGEQQRVTPAENTDAQIQQVAYSSGDYKLDATVTA